MQADDGIAPVVGAAQDLSELELGDLLRNFRDLGQRLVMSVFAFLFLSEVEEKAGLFEVGTIFFQRIEDRFERSLFFENGLRFLPILPKIGTRNDQVQLFEPLLLSFRVKDASAEGPVSLPGGLTALWSRRTWVVLQKSVVQNILYSFFAVLYSLEYTFNYAVVKARAEFVFPSNA